MAPGRRHGRGKIARILPILVLAVLCIGGMELLVCRFADPDLYQRITAPIHQGISALGEQVHTWLAQLTPVREKGQPPPAENEVQYLAQSAIWQELSTDPNITQIVAKGGQEILTGGSREIVYYNQGDPQWSKKSYGTDTIGPYGCGPTALAMVISSMTDTQIDPAQMAHWAAEQGYWARGSGSYLSIVKGCAEVYGLSVRSSQSLTLSQLRTELAGGTLVVALMGPGHFTSRGHFIVLRGTTLDGSVLVADPSSRERSLTTWDGQIILDELSSSRNNGAPLWLISKKLLP